MSSLNEELSKCKSEEDEDLVFEKFRKKYRNEFKAFVVEIRKTGIIEKLLEASTKEETIAIWKEFKSENQDLQFAIKRWSKKKDECFDKYEPFSAYLSESFKIAYMLEITIIMLIIKNDMELCFEDMSYVLYRVHVAEYLSSRKNDGLRHIGYYLSNLDNRLDRLTEEILLSLYK